MNKLKNVLIVSVLLSYQLLAGDKVVQESNVNKSELYDLKRSILSLDVGYADAHGKSTASVPVSITYEHAIDQVGLTGFRRGYTSFVFRGQNDFIVHGCESRISSVQFGPRYNFVNDTLLSYHLVPFVEGTVGLAMSDSTNDVGSNGKNVGLGQDFNFTFGEAVGVKYYINNDYLIQFALRHFHYSNGGLSEPTRENNPYDMISPTVSMSVTF